MRAAELLSAITSPAFTKEFHNIFINQNNQLVPVDRIIKQEDKLIFLCEKGSTPIKISDFYKILMLNKRCTLYYDNGNEIIRLYGYREENDKIIL